MAEYVCELPVEGMASFMSGGELIPVRERIVRCRDCRYATDEGYGCKHFSHYEQGASYRWEDVPADVEPDGFCAWGERRANG